MTNLGRVRGVERRLALAALMVGLFSFTATKAEAEPFTARAVSLSGALGFGWAVFAPSSVEQPFLAGVGARVGYTLPSGAYFGQRFDYFIGSTSFGMNFNDLGEATVHNQSWNLLFEAGYDFALGPQVVLRPKLGVGMLSWSSLSAGTAGAVFPSLELPLLAGPLTLTPELRFQTTLSSEPLGAVYGGVHAGVTLR